MVQPCLQSVPDVLMLLRPCTIGQCFGQGSRLKQSQGSSEEIIKKPRPCIVHRHTYNDIKRECDPAIYEALALIAPKIMAPPNPNPYLVTNPYPQTPHPQRHDQGKTHKKEAHFYKSIQTLCHQHPYIQHVENQNPWE
ncbi:hypothetical protein FGO68_gene11730 [Halteria grandinella]|uniref:Uncharacterized protein n=1 Tax=Halteria grandinella TaxID=5974 RepID=A0A8J8SUZ3_HALGN|nr:hypothetical protein FGO68_gene11730 [Halteria grandinella]